RRQLYADPVSRQDPDEVHPELAADVRKDAMAVLQLDREHRVRQWLDDGACDLDRVLLRQPCSLGPTQHECRPGRADTRTVRISNVLRSDNPRFPSVAVLDTRQDLRGPQAERPRALQLALRC